MKKLKELNDKELEKLFNENNDFHDYCINQAYENSMFCQESEANEMGISVFDYHDHYSSFYLSTPMVYGVKEPEKIAGKLDADYMTPENAKLYKKLCKLTEKWENLEYDDLYGDKGEKLHNDMTDICDKLADGLTEQLRAYESVSEEQAFENLKIEIENGWLDEWETDGEKIYQAITKIYA